MINERIFDNYKEFYEAHLDEIVNAAKEVSHSNEHNLVRILDIATGPNGDNPRIIKRLISEGIDYELVLSDICPTHFKKGYENLRKELSPTELQKVKCVLADATNLRKEITRVYLVGKFFRKPLNKVLQNPKYKFLSTGYQGGQRTVNFEDGSFDLVMGAIPYSSINTGDYEDAISESARVLRKDGYHIVNEMHVEELNPDIKRTSSALKRASIDRIDDIRSKLDLVLNPIAVFSIVYPYRTKERIPDQTMQNRDVVKNSVLVYKKEN